MNHVVGAVLGHHVHLKGVAGSHSSSGLALVSEVQLSLLFIFVALHRIIGVTGPLLFVHVGQSLAAVVHDLVGPFEEVVDLKVHLQLSVVLVHVADLALFVSCADVNFEVLGIKCVNDLYRVVSTKIKQLR